MIGKKSLEERLCAELLSMNWQHSAPVAVVEFVVTQMLQTQRDTSGLALHFGWNQTVYSELVESLAKADTKMPDSPGGRLFNHWAALCRDAGVHTARKRKWTQGESRQINQALNTFTEPELMGMLEWAFKGKDQYAQFLQGKVSFDDRAPKKYLGIDSLFKEKNLNKRVDNGEAFATSANRAPVNDTWLETVALPALHEIILDPDSYNTAYEWWAAQRGPVEGGAAADPDYANALVALRSWRNKRGL